MSASGFLWARIADQVRMLHTLTSCTAMMSSAAQAASQKRCSASRVRLPLQSNSKECQTLSADKASWMVVLNHAIHNPRKLSISSAASAVVGIVCTAMRQVDPPEQDVATACRRPTSHWHARAHECHATMHRWCPTALHSKPCLHVQSSTSNIVQYSAIPIVSIVRQSVHITCGNMSRAIHQHCAMAPRSVLQWKEQGPKLCLDIPLQRGALTIGASKPMIGS